MTAPPEKQTAMPPEIAEIVKLPTKNQPLLDAAEHFAEEVKAIRKILHGDTDRAMDFVLAFHAMKDFELVADIRQLKYRVFRTADGDWKYEGREATPIVRAVD